MRHKPFNIEAFLRRHGVEYVTSGKNVKAGEVNIRCPYCQKSASPDPSFHLGIDSRRHVYSCWRNAKHRGNRLTWILVEIARCSKEEAEQLLGYAAEDIASSEGIEALFNAPAQFFAEFVTETAPPPPTALPGECMPLQKRTRYSAPYFDYIANRGFTPADIPSLTERYGIHYCFSGRYQGRVVFPVYHSTQELYGWTGRAITPQAPLRYLTSSPKDGVSTNIKHTVYNAGELIGTRGKGLFVTEGPLDALKLDFYGKALGYRATCLFTVNVTASQRALLNRLAENFDYIIGCLDTPQMATSMRISLDLSTRRAGASWHTVPEEFGDPGAMNYTDVRNFINEFDRYVAQQPDCSSVA